MLLSIDNRDPQLSLSIHSLTSEEAKIFESLGAKFTHLNGKTWSSTFAFPRVSIDLYSDQYETVLLEVPRSEAEEKDLLKYKKEVGY